MEVHAAQKWRARWQVGGPYAEPQFRQGPECGVEDFEDEGCLVVRWRRICEIQTSYGIGDDEEDKAEDAGSRGSEAPEFCQRSKARNGVERG